MLSTATITIFYHRHVTNSTGRFIPSKKSLMQKIHDQPSFFLPIPQGVTSCHLVIIRGESYHLLLLLIHRRAALPSLRVYRRFPHACLHASGLQLTTQFFLSACVHILSYINTKPTQSFLRTSEEIQVPQSAKVTFSHSKLLSTLSLKANVLLDTA